ncbi:MAG: LacI family transcriptional regulator [Oceanospirillum sp.]|nr:LacI family transcriptional regulator [Oceanospirillum sp.]
MRVVLCCLFSVLILPFSLLLADNSYAEEKALIAFAQDTLKNDFRRAQVMEAKQAAQAHNNMRFTYSDAQGRTSLLIHQIEQFISRQVDILIVGTNDAQAVVPVINKAHSAGIKVIILDRGVDTDQYTTFINSDNREIGAIAGRYIAEQMEGKGRALLLEGILTADVTQQRSEGFLKVMQDYPDIKVIRRTGNYLRKDALIEMEKLLAEGIQVDAIFSESDSMLSGVRAVLTKHQIDPGSIIMIGCDYISEAQAAIRAGSQTGSVYFPLGGKAAIDAAARLLAGETLPKHLQIPADLLVTRQNVNHVQPVF